MAAATHALAVTRPGPCPDGDPACVRSAAPGRDAAAGRPCVRSAAPLPPAGTARDPYARLARGCRPRGCRAPARRVHGRRVRYVIGDEPGQVNGMRWRPGTRTLAPSPAAPAFRAR